MWKKKRKKKEKEKEKDPMINDGYFFVFCYRRTMRVLLLSGVHYRPVFGLFIHLIF